MCLVRYSEIFINLQSTGTALRAEHSATADVFIMNFSQCVCVYQIDSSKLRLELGGGILKYDKMIQSYNFPCKVK